MEKSSGYCKNKTESQRQEAYIQNENTGKLLTPGNVNQQELIQKPPLPTLKPSSTQEPTSSRARHTMLILQQSRNTALNIKRQAAQSHAKPIDTPKMYYCTLHCTPERRDPATPVRTQMQAPLTRKP